MSVYIILNNDNGKVVVQLDKLSAFSCDKRIIYGHTELNENIVIVDGFKIVVKETPEEILEIIKQVRE